MKRIYLIGYMGAGKTTLGQAFAREEKLEFIDLDWYIENRYRKEIRRLFAEFGEEGFRLIEQKMLHEVGEMENVVVACGGGTPCFFDNMDYMNRTGTSVYLDTHTQVLFDRLSIARAKRPLLANKNDAELLAFIENGLSQRKAYYTQANYCLNADLLDNHEQIHQTVARLKQLLEDKKEV